MPRLNTKTLDRVQKKILAVTEEAQKVEKVLLCTAAQYPDMTILTHFCIKALCFAAQREIERISSQPSVEKDKSV